MRSNLARSSQTKASSERRRVSPGSVKRRPWGQMPGHRLACVSGGPQELRGTTAQAQAPQPGARDEARGVQRGTNHRLNLALLIPSSRLYIVATLHEWGGEGS